ncbi:MAG TPA: hypothetical protein VGB73_07380 [Pyrinomonadaceae bacterium]|jgi:hypothetical protein
MSTEENRPAGENSDSRYRNLMLIWIAQLMSFAFLSLLPMLVGKPIDAADADDTLRQIFFAIGVTTLILSFVLKRRMLSRAIERQDARQVQAGYILAFALCEMTGLSGVLIHLTKGATSIYHLLLALGWFGLLLHWPRRSHLTDASFKSGGFGANEF